MGTLSVYTAELRNFSNEEVRILSALAEMSGIAIEKARLYERIVDIEEELRQNEKLSALGLLAAEVAHEIRNPLTVMKMLYHSLDLKFSEGDPRNRDAEMMSEKMNHLNKIVEQILNYARTAEPNLAQVNINKLVDDMALLTRHKLSNQNIHFIRELDPELPMVLADSTQLEQALLNLTLNAAEAMPEGGTLTVATRVLKPATDEKSSFVILEVKDTGEGMNEEQQERAFSSLLNTTKKTGTGLGLAIVSKIVETHNGRIKVHSGVGKGTSIELHLPIN
jgi:signal transduction histidine kinase